MNCVSQFCRERTDWSWKSCWFSSGARFRCPIFTPDPERYPRDPGDLPSESRAEDGSGTVSVVTMVPSVTACHFFVALIPAEISGLVPSRSLAADLLWH